MNVWLIISILAVVGFAAEWAQGAPLDKTYQGGSSVRVEDPGGIYANDVDAQSAGTQSFCASTATACEIGKSGATTTVKGSLIADEGIGESGTTTTILGEFNVDEAATFDSTLDVTGAVDLSSTLDVAGAVELGNGTSSLGHIVNGRDAAGVTTNYGLRIQDSNAPSQMIDLGTDVISGNTYISSTSGPLLLFADGSEQIRIEPKTTRFAGTSWTISQNGSSFRPLGTGITGTATAQTLTRARTSLMVGIYPYIYLQGAGSGYEFFDVPDGALGTDVTLTSSDSMGYITESGRWRFGNSSSSSTTAESMGYTKLGEAVDGGGTTPAFAVKAVSCTLDTSSPYNCDADHGFANADRIKAVIGTCSQSLASPKQPLWNFASSFGIGDDDLSISTTDSKGSGQVCDFYIFYEAS